MNQIAAQSSGSTFTSLVLLNYDDDDYVCRRRMRDRDSYSSRDEPQDRDRERESEWTERVYERANAKRKVRSSLSLVNDFWWWFFFGSCCHCHSNLSISTFVVQFRRYENLTFILSACNGFNVTHKSHTAIFSTLQKLFVWKKKLTTS